MAASTLPPGLVSGTPSALPWLANPGASLLSTWWAECLPCPRVASRSAAVATPYSLAMRPRSWSDIWLIGTLNFFASRSRSLRPISTALLRWSSLSQCLILLRARALDEGKPVAARFVILLGDDFDDIPGPQLRAQGHHAAVHLGAHAGVADLCVNRISEIYRRGV